MSSTQKHNGEIDKLDFNSQRAHSQHNSDSDTSGPSHLLDDDESFFSNVARGVVRRDRRSMQRAAMRYLSFACAMLSCLCAGSITAYSLYGHLFLSRLRYTQLQVNIVSITAELAMYLPVPLFGYLCDRYSPRPLSLFAGLVFGLGYLLAAFTYRHGPSVAAGGEGWAFGVMVLAFVGIGMGTSCMYLSAVTTCAKNFGRGRHKGFALAMPIAAFGLSGMWQSQVGSRLLYEVAENGKRGDVDVFKYFLFLGVTLLVVGIIGAVGLRVVDEEDLIDEAVEELERSGLLEDSALFRHVAIDRGYGTLDGRRSSNEEQERIRREAEESKRLEQEGARKKTWLLNEETRQFLRDPTMWFLAAGFFLVTGPGEAFINNLGTIIGTLYPPSSTSTTSSDPNIIIPTTAATHVSIVAITSTIARILTGTLSDLLAPIPAPHHYRPLARSTTSSLHHQDAHTTPPPPKPRTFTLSRVPFLLTFAALMSLGQIVLASGSIQDHGSRFWIVSALIGAGYGAVFSLTPIICSVVWGVENFGTNWGIVVMVPALGATVWGVIYSAVYSWAAARGKGKGGGHVGVGVGREADALCYGRECYAPTFWAMALSVWVACGLWMWAWRGKGGWKARGVAV